MTQRTKRIIAFVILAAFAAFIYWMIQSNPQQIARPDRPAEPAAENAPSESAALSEETPPETAAEEEIALAPPPAAEDATDPVEESAAEAPVAEAEPDPEPQPAETAETAAEEAKAPESAATLDIVRVEPGGSTLVAGTATPGAEISLFLDGDVMASETVDGVGGFVIFAEIGTSTAPRVLTFAERLSDGTVLAAPDSVILAPVAPLPVETAVAEDAPGTDVAAAPLPDVVTTPDTGDGTPAAPETPPAPTVLVANEDGVRVVQNPADQPEAMDNVSIDSISYDEAGEVALAGRATGQSSVRVYLDNEPLLDVDIGADGQWRTELPDVDTGTYTLRVDELDAEGKVISRAESPFRREAVEAIQELNLDTDLSISAVSLITVQPGNTLWGIARDKYGEGPLYVRVFEANTDRIRDPDLIYPGQIFSIPE